MTVTKLTNLVSRTASLGAMLLAGTALFVLVDPLAGMTVPTARAETDIVNIARYGPGVSREIKLGLNKAVVIDLPTDAHDILVADPSVADAVTRSSRRIYLFGKTVGQTNIFVFGANGSPIVSIDLSIERDVASLQRQLTRFIPDSDIKVEIINDNIVLTGTVRTPEDSARAAQLANIFVTGGEATTRNITATGGNAAGGAAIFAEQRQKSQIVNMLQIDGQDQVTLKITVAEVKRSILKQLGIDSSISGSGGGLTTASFASNNVPVESLIAGSAGANATRVGIAGTIGSFGLSATIHAMEQANVIRTLAEPTLTAISGENANFHVGGQVFFATTTSTVTGQTTLQGIDYGISLGFTPVVLSAGRISLKINTEVSEPQNSGGSFSKNERTADTSVELPSGGSIVIAGLLSDNMRQTISGAPGLSKIPILGTLFRSRDFVNNQTELVIIATPYLVRPVARNKLSRPDDNFVAASDGAGYFLGRVNKIYGRMKTDLPNGRYHGVVGYIYK